MIHRDKDGGGWTLLENGVPYWLWISGGSRMGIYHCARKKRESNSYYVRAERSLRRVWRPPTNWLTPSRRLLQTVRSWVGNSSRLKDRGSHLFCWTIVISVFRCQQFCFFNGSFSFILQYTIMLIPLPPLHRRIVLVISSTLGWQYLSRIQIHECLCELYVCQLVQCRNEGLFIPIVFFSKPWVCKNT